jgi:hypothetical protein
LWCELTQARPKGGSWANLYKASLHELDEEAGASVANELRRARGKVGTRWEQLGDSGRRREYLCSVFERENELAPVVGFLLTRVAPLGRETA